MRVLALLAAAVVVYANATPSSDGSESLDLQQRRFADVGGDFNETELLCHRLHLLPVGSPGRERALRGCPERPSLPSVVKDPPGSIGTAKDKFKTDFDKKRDELLSAKKNRKPTPEEDAALKALDAKYNDIKKMETDFSANAAKRQGDQDKADASAQQDIDDKAKQWDAVMKDDIRKVQHDADKAADAADKVRDALDVKRVADAKTKLKDFEDSVMDAKAKAAGDPKVLQDLDDQIGKMKARRKADEEQRVKDEEQAKQDQQLADSAEKRQREQDRSTRAKQRENNANEFQDTLNRARIAREDALKRKDLLRNEEAERARLKQQQKDDEDALAANRKSREADAAERQKRMDEYKNAEPDMIKRKKDYDDAEAQRVKRAKDRDEARRKREKDAEDERARLKRAKEDEVPHEERPKRDDEEDCKDKKVNCGSGKCFQKINDPDSKRCQCQPGDKGANCEHKGCEYDLTDRTGKSRRHRGNQVDGECVRWKAVYRCTCDKPWRLDVTCVTKDPAKGATKELEVSDQKCKGLRKPENLYAKHTCSLCSRGCRVSRQLGGEGNETLARTESHRALVSEVSFSANDKKDFQLSCKNERMVENHIVAFAFSKNKKTKASSSTSSHRRLVKRKREDDDPDKPPHAIEKNVPTFEDCQDICLERAGGNSASTADGIADESTHCTWVWYDAFNRNCYIFINGMFPDHAIEPPTGNAMQTQQTTQPPQMQTPPTTSGFIAFVSYPRRFNLYSAFSDTAGRPHEVFGDYRVVFGEETNDEDKLTFAYKSENVHPHCVANRDTVREAALVYEKTLPIPRAPLVLLPDSLRAFGSAQTQSIEAEVVSKSSKVKWTYKFDTQLRVIEVRGISTSLSSGDRGDEHLEAHFGKLTRQTKLGVANAPFAAGHLVAYKQKPPNFFFNYVPQHANSNSLGAWHYTEDAAVTFIQLGCKIEYVVINDYGRNGIDSPSTVRTSMPQWARQYANDDPTAAAGGTGTDTDTTANPASVYINDDLRCHYRFRPYTMSIDFRIRDFSKTKTCEHLYGGIGEDELLTIQLDATNDNGNGNSQQDDNVFIKTTRIKAYLIQKKNAAEDPASTITYLRRVFQVATAKHKTSSKLLDYAETGNIAPFTKIQMDFDFKLAFLGTLAATGLYERCLRFKAPNGDSKCDKWTMVESRPEGESTGRGVLMRDEDAGNSQCITFSGGVAVLVTPTDKTVCASFEYLYKEHVLDSSAKTKLNLGTAATDAPVSQDDNTKLESLILGRVVIPKADGKGELCLRRDYQFTDEMSQCWHLRIGYYPYRKDAHTKD
ncbi:hypothetical protein PINS_up004333 [Pythium insidiosum]|nr:hypothetical protein PINS_up004333 [Pythium insidiosum]